jgi:hypothetical protein
VTEKRSTKRLLKISRDSLNARIREVTTDGFDVEAEVKRVHPNWKWTATSKAGRRLEGISLLLRTAVYDAIPDHWVQ